MKEFSKLAHTNMEIVHRQWDRASVGLRIKIKPVLEACHEQIHDAILFIEDAAQKAIVKYHDDVFTEEVAKWVINKDTVLEDGKVTAIRTAVEKITAAYRWIYHLNCVLGSFARLATVQLLRSVPIAMQMLYTVSQFCHDSMEAQILTFKFDMERRLNKDSDHCMRAALEAKKASDLAQDLKTELAADDLKTELAANKGLDALKQSFSLFEEA